MVTVKDVRKAYKLSYDLWIEDRLVNNKRIADPRPVTLDSILHDLMDYERQFAEQVFVKTLGLNDPKLDGFSFDDAVDTFSGQYIKLGLATGEHQVAELVRNIERQAVAQANQHLGRRPY